jgi:hypothetical protein
MYPPTHDVLSTRDKELERHFRKLVTLSELDGETILYVEMATLQGRWRAFYVGACIIDHILHRSKDRGADFSSRASKVISKTRLYRITFVVSDRYSYNRHRDLNHASMRFSPD